VRIWFVRILVASAIGIALAGCESSAPRSRTLDSVPQLSPGSASAAGLSTEEVRDATELYGVKCAKCHKFYDPTQYSQAEWDDWMRRMSRKARLTPVQKELLTRYLAGFRVQQK
jgi:cytochrome c5